MITQVEEKGRVKPLSSRCTTDQCPCEQPAAFITGGRVGTLLRVYVEGHMVRT